MATSTSPNIAKPFSVGHLRSTIIGQALHNILSFLGYQVIGDNHLGDWGTQFGKLLSAFAHWGSEDELERNPTAHLLSLYVRFHEEARTNAGLEFEARDWFRRLETGDEKARMLWQRFVRFSTSEFGRIYDLLGVKFDSMRGESAYEDRLSGVISRALESGVARREKPAAAMVTGGDEVGPDETVVIIPLNDVGIETPLILQKSDGTSLYATREIATAEYRIERWHPEKMLYVVGKEQELYFRQFSAALVKLGIPVPCVHVTFGLVRLPEGRMSTREGRVVFLEDVISEAIRRAEAVVQDRDLSPEEKARISRIVGIGAIRYADLSQSRIKEVVFALSPVCIHAHPVDTQEGPGLLAAILHPSSFILRSSGGTSLAQVRRPVPGRYRGRGRVVRAAPDCRTHLPHRPRLLGILRQGAGAQGRDPRTPRRAALPGRDDREGPRDRPRPPRHRSHRPDVATPRIERSQMSEARCQKSETRVL